MVGATQWDDATAQRGSTTQHSVCPHPQWREGRKRWRPSRMVEESGKGDGVGQQGGRHGVGWGCQWMEGGIN